MLSAAPFNWQLSASYFVVAHFHYVIVGAIIVVGSTDSLLVEVLGTIAVAFGAINVAGGFLVTDRMLHMFKARPQSKDGDG